MKMKANKSKLKGINLQLFAGTEGYLKDELQGFVPTETANEIMGLTARGSSVLRLAKVEPMTSDTKKFPMQVSGPGAYWVGESERIKTSKAQWIFPQIVAKKLGVIIPVTKEKLNDSTIDVLNELKPNIAEAFHKAIDSACLFGTNSPFTTNIMKSITDSGQAIEVETNGAGKLDLDVSDAMSLVEEISDPNAFVAHNGIKNSLRKLRDANGNQLFISGGYQGTSTLYELPIEFSRNGSFNKSKAEIIAGDFNMAIAGIRQGIEYEILKEATLQSVTMVDGLPLSLAENDMIALKATMRIGFLVVKDEAFSAVVPKAVVPGP